MNRRLFAKTAACGGLLGASHLAVFAQEAARASGKPESDQRRLREPFPNDPHRPRYHFLPPRNWMNDPNGLIFHRGNYHLFFQHNPGAAVWGDMHWGHAFSKDLISWQHLPMALAPTPDGYDKDGVFSGCAVVNGDEPTIIYTGTKPEVQAIATSKHPLLETWTKFDGNPVIPGPPEGMEVTGFRDPYVWKEGDDWLMALGSGLKGQGGAILLYRSSDLRKWDYLHPLVDSTDKTLGTMWECPNFFPLGDKHVLLISPIPLRKALYAIGSYRSRRFEIESVGSLDDGGHFYAPQVFLDGANRHVMFGWCWEGRAKEAQVEAGWAGVQSLPRVLTLAPGGRLRIEPHPLCQRLTGFGTGLRSQALGEELQSALTAQKILGNAGRLDAVVELAGKDPFSLLFYRSPDGAEETRLTYHPERGRLVIDRSKSSLSSSQAADEFSAPLALAKDEALNISLYLDRSIVEVYANGSCCMTTRVYPTRVDSVGFGFSGGNKKTLIRELRWRPISLRTS